jgi:hypothetical protein
MAIDSELEWQPGVWYQPITYIYRLALLRIARLSRKRQEMSESRVPERETEQHRSKRLYNQKQYDTNKNTHDNFSEYADRRAVVMSAVTGLCRRRHCRLGSKRSAERRTKMYSENVEARNDPQVDFACHDVT